MILLYIGIGVLLLGLLIALTLYLIKLHNKLIKLEIEVKKEYSNIDVSLKKRSDLIPKIVDTVKGYIKHEQNLLTELTKIRKGENEKELIASDIETTSLLKDLFAVVENYPDLKASTNFMHLQDELTKIEIELSNTREIYNKAVLNYNNEYLIIPAKFFASLLGFKKHEYFEISDKERDMPEIKFWWRYYATQK